MAGLTVMEVFNKKNKQTNKQAHASRLKCSESLCCYFHEWSFSQDDVVDDEQVGGALIADVVELRVFTRSFQSRWRTPFSAEEKKLTDSFNCFQSTWDPSPRIFPRFSWDFSPSLSLSFLLPNFEGLFFVSLLLLLLFWLVFALLSNQNKPWQSARSLSFLRIDWRIPWIQTHCSRWDETFNGKPSRFFWAASNGSWRIWFQNIIPPGLIYIDI